MIAVPPLTSLPRAIGAAWRAVLTDLLLRMLESLADAEPPGYILRAKDRQSSPPTAK